MYVSDNGGCYVKLLPCVESLLYQGRKIVEGVQRRARRASSAWVMKKDCSI